MNNLKEKVIRNSKIVNSWRSKVFTQKGKKIGFPDTWKTYEGFYNEVGKDYKDGYILRRIDITKPYSKENCIWDVKGSENNTKNAKLEYKGETKFLYEWCDIFKLNFNGVRQRFYRGKNYTSEEILFGKKKKSRFEKECKDVNDKNIRTKASKMISSYKVKDFKNNTEICDFSIDWFIENIMLKPCVYCGDTKRIGADRIDNTKGHTKENCVPCCIECNIARGNNFTYEEMKRLGKTIKEIKTLRNERDNAKRIA